MNLGRCERGHFYDMEKYSTCPHCAGGAATGDNSMTTIYTEGNDTVPVTEQGMRMTAPVNPPQQEQFDATPMQAVPENDLPVANFSANMLTMPIGESGTDTPTVPLMNDSNNIDMAEDDNDHTVGFFDDIFNNLTNNASQETQQQNNNKSGNVSSVPANANNVSTPCVGWLIALGGVHIGTDFRLKAGKNFIGRDASMDVALTWDKSVSRKRHAIVVYEPKQHLYLVQPGDSSGLVYRNNEVVLTPVKLEAYDTITVGEVNLLFIPLCGERFNWGNLFDEMNKK